jgi:NAD(P)-dependent dehydrogenase (short-subunit alcohol dehydrogenase family)
MPNTKSARITSLEGKTVVVGGASRNLGSLISRTLAADGANVVVHYNSASSEQDANATAQAVKQAGTDAITVQGDLTKTDQVTALFDAAEQRFGELYASVNTAGMVIKKPIVEVTEQEYDQMHAVNAKAAYLVMQEAARRLTDGGKILTIVTSLLAAYAGGYSIYAGGKAPVEDYTRALSKELFGKNISVNALAPGPMDTPFFYPAETEDSISFHKNSVMNGELTKIEDIVPWVRFLLTEGWWANGQTLLVNGGYTTR